MVVPVTVSSSAVALNNFLKAWLATFSLNILSHKRSWDLILSYRRHIINCVCSFLNYKKAEGTGNESVSNDVTSADFFFFNFMCMRVFCLNGYVYVYRVLAWCPLVVSHPCEYWKLNLGPLQEQAMLKS